MHDLAYLTNAWEYSIGPKSIKLEAILSETEAIKVCMKYRKYLRKGVKDKPFVKDVG